MGDLLNVLAYRCFSFPNEHIINSCELERKDLTCKSEIDCDAMTDDNKGGYEKKTPNTHKNKEIRPLGSPALTVPYRRPCHLHRLRPKSRHQSPSRLHHHPT